jgi:hypothetical protein
MDILIDRVANAEQVVNRAMQAPTVPIYDPTNLPQDVVTAQVAVGTDYSFNWYDGSSWHTKAGALSVVGNIPQDAVDGQIVIGVDGSFHWFISGTWYTAMFAASTLGSVPQDTVLGQVAIGADGSFHWYDGTQWQTFSA